MAGKSLKKYKDIDLTFRVHPMTNELSTLKDGRAINQSLTNILQLLKKDRPFEPQRTPNIRNLLFEPVAGGEAATLRQRIKMAITQMEPRVKIMALEVIPQPNENRYQIILQYRIRETGQEVEFRDVLRRVA